jgi:hypothetical protein
LAYDVTGIRFLLHAADRGVNYSTAATLGHLYLFGDQADIAEALAACRGEKSPEVAEAIYRDCAGYVDGVLRYLGADQVESIDASDYEGATIVHDLNEPISPELEEKFSVLVDGGSLEHIFDLPVAIRNAMRMVEVGGHLILKVPVNNYAGHGFYQVSPEFFFRVLSPPFGYHVLDAVIVELYHPRARWFRVKDPLAVGHRVMFRSHSRTDICVLAERIGPVPEFKPTPMQSDYSTAWERVNSTHVQPNDADPIQVATTSAQSPALTRVSASARNLACRAKELVRRSLPEPLYATAARSKQTIVQSKRYRRLNVWLVWAVPALGMHPHYSRARSGFEPVHEPWTASVHPPRLPGRRETDAPPSLFGHP